MNHIIKGSNNAIFIVLNAAQETIEIIDRGGKVVRSYSSTDPVLQPEPGVDMAGYDQVCRKRPTATYCGLPLYWPAVEMKLGTRAGMHRAWWDLHFEPFPAPDIEDAGDEGATGAVPHHTYPDVNAPWAPPGAYTVRLTGNGKSVTQPLTLRLDPRVKTPTDALTRLATLSREMYDGARAAREAYIQARALAAAASKLTGNDIDAFRARLDSLAPAPIQGARSRFRGRGPASTPATLESASDALLAAAMAMQGADVAPTAGQVAACDRARTQAAQVTAQWSALKTAGLAALNAKRRAAGLPPLLLPN